ncbi:MAG: ATP-binding protein [Planctomycetes bacterium]|nr:ATP-binding protein [Planctomycetota bacterium]
MTDNVKDRLVINSELKHLNLARHFIVRTIRKVNLAPSDENKIVLATDEALSNIVEHAYEFNKSGYIDINVEVTPKQFQIRILNGGRDFDLEKVKIKDIMEHVKQGKRRGLGIFLMRRIMDEVKYSFKNGQNQLILIKYLTTSDR